MATGEVVYYTNPYYTEIQTFLAQDTDELIHVISYWVESQDQQLICRIGRIAIMAKEWLSDMAKQVDRLGDARSQEVVAAIKPRVNRLEHVKRKFSLLSPRSWEEFSGNLFWLTEKGRREDLEMLRRTQERLSGEFRIAALKFGGIAERHIAESSHERSETLLIWLPCDLPKVAKEYFWGLQRIKRRLDLRYPSSLDDFIGALYWMAEQGDIDDLEELRRVRADPPYDSEEIRRLFATAEERIHDRVYDPQTVVDREEAAYQEHRQEWDEKYKSEFIAIHRGQVIDHDTDKYRLIQRLDQKQRETGRFSAYIVQIGAPVYVARGPTMGRRRYQRDARSQS